MRARIQNLRDPLHRGQPPLDAGERPAQRDGGPRELGEVAVEGHERTQGDAPVHHRLAAQPEDDQGADPRDQAHERPRHRLGAGQGEVARPVLVVEPGELGDLPVLHGVRAHHRHAGEVLLGLGRQRAELLLHGGGAHLHVVIEALGDHHQARKRRHREQGQPRVDRPHGAEGAREREDRADQHHAAEAGEGAQGRDVVRRARHQVAGAVGVVEGGRQRQQSRVQRGAEVVLHPLPRPQDREAGAEPGRAVTRREGQDEEHEGGHVGGGAVALEGIHRTLHRPRDADRHQRGEEQAGRPAQVAQAIAEQIRQEASERGHGPV